MYLMPISRQLVNHQIDSKSPFNSHRNLAMPEKYVFMSGNLEIECVLLLHHPEQEATS